MNSCPNCGGTIIGDGYTTVRHCENSESEHIWDSEPDASVILCDLVISNEVTEEVKRQLKKD